MSDLGCSGAGFLPAVVNLNCTIVRVWDREASRHHMYRMPKTKDMLQPMRKAKLVPDFDEYISMHFPHVPDIVYGILIAKWNPDQVQRTLIA